MDVFIGAVDILLRWDVLVALLVGSIGGVLIGAIVQFGACLGGSLCVFWVGSSSYEPRQQVGTQSNKGPQCGFAGSTPRPTPKGHGASPRPLTAIPARCRGQCDTTPKTVLQGLGNSTMAVPDCL